MPFDDQKSRAGDQRGAFLSDHADSGYRCNLIWAGGDLSLACRAWREKQCAGSCAGCVHDAHSMHGPCGIGGNRFSDCGGLYLSDDNPSGHAAAPSVIRSAAILVLLPLSPFLYFLLDRDPLRHPCPNAQNMTK